MPCFFCKKFNDVRESRPAPTQKASTFRTTVTSKAGVHKSQTPGSHAD